MPTFAQNGIEIAYDVIGKGPPVLLLHGFPQTRALWRNIAGALSDRFTMVMPDMRGYGASSKPAALPDLSNYSFRAMAEDQIALMASLGHDRFHLVGHDRGGRVAYRMALDAPHLIHSLTVMDIVPTAHLLDHWSEEVATAYFHWTYMTQPAPFPEHMIATDPDHFYEACLLGWGGASISDFSEIDAYRRAWRDPATIAGMCNDYRAALRVDAPLDRLEMAGPVAIPSLVLYGADGVMARLFDVPGTWEALIENVTARAIPGGHFFIDQSPDETGHALAAFLDGV